MSWSELDIPTSDELEDDFSNSTLHPFSMLKAKLKEMGVELGTAVPYRPIAVADVTKEDIESGAIEFTPDGIFVTSDGIRQKVFLYKRDYRLAHYGNPRAHIRKCDVLDRFTSANGTIPLYRRANTDTVWVHDMDDNMKDKQVSGLNICSRCIAIAQEAYPKMTAAEFVELLKTSEDAIPETNVEVDIFGYTSDWEEISRNIRETHDFTCEICGLHISDPYDRQYIHVHHVNGRKIDNRTANLQCLCLRCHANIDDNHKHRLTESGANRVIFEEFDSKYPKSSITYFSQQNNLVKPEPIVNDSDDFDLPF